MAATFATQSKMIQQTFDWEQPADDVSVSQVAPRTFAVAVADEKTSLLTTTRRRSASAPTDASAPSSSLLIRRNRCEHVGGVMATVLSKYGLGLDDLLHAIDNLRMERSQVCGTSQSAK